MSRKDAFRPSVIDPTKFESVSQHYLGPVSDDMADSGICDEMAEQQQILEEHQAAHPGFTVAGHKWPGQCDCCGARYLWGATFYTAETNTYISIGGICAGKLRLGSPEAMKTFREQVNTWRVHQERLAVARTFAATHSLQMMIALFLGKDDSREFPEVTLRDMAGKLIRYGSISEKQIAFAQKLIAQIQDRPRLQAEREARDENRKPIPAFLKRATIEGTIISAKFQEGGWVDGKDFYQPTCIKITIEHADGWRVWGTAPADLGFGDGQYHSGEATAAFLKGKKVRLDARVTVSDKDSKFGFFKRPTKAALDLTNTAEPATI
jgi:hypothetical protein